MICLLDKTFCIPINGVRCKTIACHRHQRIADLHYKEHPDEKLPVAWADFTEKCPDYKPEEEYYDD